MEVFAKKNEKVGKQKEREGQGMGKGGKSRRGGEIIKISFHKVCEKSSVNKTLSRV